MMLCKNCGRPKGTSKAWRPDPRPEGWRSCNKCVYVERNPLADLAGISESGVTNTAAPSTSSASANATPSTLTQSAETTAPASATDGSPHYVITGQSDVVAEELSLSAPLPNAATTTDAPIDVKAALAALMAEADEPEAQEVYAENTFTDLTNPENRAALVERAQEVAAQPPFSVATAPSGSARSTAAGFRPTLLEHSPLGGSGSKRYLSCSGSVLLTQTLRAPGGDGRDEEEEWTAEGLLGHLLGAHCLEKNHDPMLYIAGRDQWEAIDEGLACAVQEYTDYVNSRPGQMLIEYKAHRPELHPLMYGAIDCVKYGVMQPFLEIIDLKMGAGVIVEVEKNDQLRYYAILYIMADPTMWPDDTPVHLTICQPRAFHAGGKIRTWTTTVGDLKRWLYETLLPGMQRTAEIQGLFLDMGEHCQFCPAKIACPAMGNLVRKALIDAKLHITGTEEKPIFPPGWKPVLDGDEAKYLRMLLSAYNKWSFSQLQGGASPEFVGMKMVFGKSYRVWKEGAEEAAKVLGESAYTKPELISPAQLEKLPGGAAIVAEHAYAPDGKLTIAPLSDPRPAVMGKSASALFGRHIQKALAQEA